MDYESPHFPREFTLKSVMLSIALGFVFSANAHAQMLNNTWSQTPAQTAYVVPAVFAMTIADLDGRPVAGAQVMIGDAADVPFMGNRLISDVDGRVGLPVSWIDPQPITIEAPGFVRTTYMAVSPSMATLQIRRATQQALAQPTSFELKGNTSGFGQLKNDGIFDIGLVVQAIPRAAISSVSMTSLISPEIDHFTVMGQSVDLPSNITIPAQTENYIFPLKFDKSIYRLYLPTIDTYKISALHAQVPFKATIDAVRNGKTFVDMVNTFNFREGSLTDVTITGPKNALDLVVNTTPFTKSVPFTAPTFANTLDLLAIALSQSNGLYYPTDIKNVASAQTVQLSAPAGAMTNGMVLAAYRKAGAKPVGAGADQFTAVVLPNNETHPFDPIRLVNPPQATNATKLVLDRPTPTADLNPIMTYAVLNVVTSITQGSLELERKQAQWDVWAPSWVGTLALPQKALPKIDPANQVLRWEVGFSAQFVGDKAAPPGPAALEKITHVTRSAVDL